MPSHILPLQLPDWRPAPTVDWTPLGQIGDALADFRRRDQIAKTIAGAGGDPAQTGRALAEIGATGEARPYLALAQQQAEAARTQANADRSFAFQQAQAARAQRNAERSFELQRRQLTQARVPVGFEPTSEGGLRPIAGGPQDPAYLQQRVRASGGQGVLPMRDPGAQAPAPELAQVLSSAQAALLAGKLTREQAIQALIAAGLPAEIANGLR